jgi:hypothetical protein
MARVELITWSDLVEHLTDWMGANPSGEARRDAKRASLSALRATANAHGWSYYLTRGRLNTVASYATGTVSYDHTGGMFERLVALASGTWPSWAAQGTLMINDVTYEVAERKSDTQITLSTNSNPGADVASTNAWTIYRDTFPLPTNFQSMGELFIATHARLLGWEHPSSWLARQRVYRGTSIPSTYTVLGETNYQNVLSIAFYPPPDQVYAVDYIYKRHPRPLRVESEISGKVSVGVGSTAVTGTGTAFASSMVGSVIRVGDASTVPTARWGNAPAADERLVTAVASATSLTVDSGWSVVANGVKYVISDPVDIHVGSMLTALLRRAELETGHARNKRDRAELEVAAQRELLMAREADARNMKEERAGSPSFWPVRFADMPFNASEG